MQVIQLVVYSLCHVSWCFWLRKYDNLGYLYTFAPISPHHDYFIDIENLLSWICFFSAEIAVKVMDGL